MSKRLKQHAPKLRLLCKFNNDRKRRWLEKNLDDSLLICLCECSLNILNGNIPLLPKQKEQLAKHKECLRQLIDKKISKKKKKEILQDGGFLGLVLGPIVSVLSGLLGGNASN